jgi:hypothetical protein
MQRIVAMEKHFGLADAPLGGLVLTMTDDRGKNGGEQ